MVVQYAGLDKVDMDGGALMPWKMVVEAVWDEKDNPYAEKYRTMGIRSSL